MGLFAHLDMRRLTVIALLALTCVLLFIGLTSMQWCMPALHSALVFATVLGTWWLARDDLALNGSGAVAGLVLTGLAVGLGLAWLGALVAALLAAGDGAPWTIGELNQVVRYFIEDVARHWTPLGLVASFAGTGLTLVLNEVGTGPSGRDHRAR